MNFGTGFRYSAFYSLWDGKMSSNSFTWVTEGGDLGTADWGCLAAAAPACVCRLNTVAVRQAALVSDESALEACLRRCAIQIDDLYLFLLDSWYKSLLYRICLGKAEK